MRTVIHRDNLPTRINIAGSIVLYTTGLSYWNAPEWLWGVVGTGMLMVAISIIIDYNTPKYTYKIGVEEEDGKTKAVKKTK